MRSGQEGYSFNALLTTTIQIILNVNRERKGTGVLQLATTLSIDLELADVGLRFWRTHSCVLL